MRSHNIFQPFAYNEIVLTNNFMKLKEKLGNLAFDLFKIIVAAVIIGGVFTDALNKQEALIYGSVLATLFLIIGIILNKNS